MEGASRRSWRPSTGTRRSASIVLRGAGQESFASGADIGEFATVRADAEGGRLYEAANEAAFWAVAHCSKPVIAMIRGFCLGGGFGLALSCDLRVASENAIFGIPAARLGIGYPPGAMKLVTAAVGAPAAKDLFFTARRIGAQEASRLGVVQRLVPDERAGTTVSQLRSRVHRGERAADDQGRQGRHRRMPSASRIPTSIRSLSPIGASTAPMRSRGARPSWRSASRSSPADSSQASWR